MKTKPLTILFDANPLVNGNKSGVGYYTLQIIQALADTYPEDIRLIGHYFSFLGNKDSAELPIAPNIKYVRSRIIPGKILSLTRALGFQLPLELFFKRSGDAALFTNFVSLPSITKVPRLVAIHDLCYIDVPQYVSKKNRDFLLKFVPKSIKTASKVITISEATRNSIMNHYEVSEDRFVITPIPPSINKTDAIYDLKTIGVEGKFILFVSTLEPRKNVINLVKAYEQLPDNFKKEYQLVLAGGTGWYMEETMAYIKSLQDKGERIITPGYISDECRNSLYKNASLFVLPSHYEGFGMPILEAMNYGVPTAVSDIPVFHEVAGDAAVYFDKDDPLSIANTLERVLDSESMGDQMIARGTECLKIYAWDKVAGTLMTAIKESIRN